MGGHPQGVIAKSMNPKDKIISPVSQIDFRIRVSSKINLPFWIKIQSSQMKSLGIYFKGKEFLKGAQAS